VRIFERKPGGMLYIGVPRVGGGYRSVSLGHTDQERAKAEALKLAAERQERNQEDRAAETGPLTVVELFRLYLGSIAGKHCKRYERHVERSAKMWAKYLGPTFRIDRFGRQEWDAFQGVRGAGELDSRGNPVADPWKRERVRARVVARDLLTLRAACGYALTVRTPGGGYRLVADPTRKLRVPVEPNTHRPVADADRVDALLAAAPKVLSRVGIDGQWEPTPLPVILRIAVDTGRRKNAILHLRASDWRPDLGTYGKLRWRAETDKKRREWLSPVTPALRDVLESYRKERALVGEAWMFPSPADPTKPLPPSTADNWLIRAEELAGLEHLERGCWHPFRRAWATSRKHLPVRDVAEAGGWQSVAVLLACYQLPDDMTTEEVVLNPKRIRKLSG
jgi:integrase